MNRLAALLALIPAPAFAQPAVQPTRDVVVTYRVEGAATGLVPGGLPGTVRLSWDAAGQRLRAESDGRAQVALLDLRTHAGQLIDTTLRIAMPLPVRAADLQPLTLEGARLTPTGKASVAGLPCTTYAVETQHGPGAACLTADGVPLRGAGRIQGRPGSFTAVAVSYGRVPPALFDVPPGYIALGGGAGQGGLAGLAGKLGGMNELRGLLGPAPR